MQNSRFHRLVHLLVAAYQPFRPRRKRGFCDDDEISWSGCWRPDGMLEDLFLFLFTPQVRVTAATIHIIDLENPLLSWQCCSSGHLCLELCPKARHCREAELAGWADFQKTHPLFFGCTQSKTLIKPAYEKTATRCFQSLRQSSAMFLRKLLARRLFASALILVGQTRFCPSRRRHFFYLNDSSSQ